MQTYSAEIGMWPGVLPGMSPTVCAIMLTADRPGYARRAVEAFRRQTYPAKRLLVLDSGTMGWRQADLMPIIDADDTQIIFAPGEAHKTIGELRNVAASNVVADIIVHFDDDDVSHPNRIAEQVALLQSSGAEAVGYREMLFWRECSHCHGFTDYCADVAICEYCKGSAGEAWRYTNGLSSYCLGTSLCYWRKTWEARPFEARPSKAEPWTSEDAVWLQGVRSVGYRSIGQPPGLQTGPSGVDQEPRMVARIHPGNTSIAYNPALMRASEMQGGEWKRVPAWDDHCARLMK